MEEEEAKVDLNIELNNLKDNLKEYRELLV